RELANRQRQEQILHRPSEQQKNHRDFKLLAALGAWLGWQQLPLLILLSSIVGAIIGIALLRAQKNGLNKVFPFGPFLAIAGWISLMWGPEITNWYLTTMLGMPL
ncbi:MAG: prepilin peptidase, partial [Aliivibrio sp.]|uniref:prepilin peptidase n=1 Tax=Aliivibrio sp. TaxID=1872443 RepID=UPI001A541F6E|nr:prepilin peptidase [Aliivibrio sp.]